MIGKVTRSSIANSVLCTIVARDYSSGMILETRTRRAIKLLGAILYEGGRKTLRLESAPAWLYFFGVSTDGPCVAVSVKVAGAGSLARTGAGIGISGISIFAFSGSIGFSRPL